MHFMTRCAATAALALLGAGTAFAQATIDQSKALAGNVTPGDAAGFPITLSVPGHYKLMGNLVVPAGTSGILVAASNVTIDLNGFTISGPNTCTYSGATRTVSCTAFNSGVTGISEASGAQGHTAVRNGHVRGFAGYGISLVMPGALIENVSASHNGVSGLDLADAGRIVGATVSMNRSFGIQTQGLAMIERSQILRNSKGVFGLSDYVIDSVVGYSAVGVEGVRLRGVQLRANLNDGSLGVVSLGGNSHSGGTLF